MMPRLILASTSAYRRQLLSRLQLEFDTGRPEVDEQPQSGEAPSALASRLAAEKAAAVAVRLPGAWVIGSDQVADLDGQALGKPGTRAQAQAQLTAMSGRT
ncbi:Maf family protein, partial [Xanthomonas oryzae]